MPKNHTVVYTKGLKTYPRLYKSLKSTHPVYYLQRDIPRPSPPLWAFIIGIKVYWNSVLTYSHQWTLLISLSNKENAPKTENKHGSSQKSGLPLELRWWKKKFSFSRKLGRSRPRNMVFFLFRLMLLLLLLPWSLYICQSFYFCCSKSIRQQ